MYNFRKFRKYWIGKQVWNLVFTIWNHGVAEVHYLAILGGLKTVNTFGLYLMFGQNLQKFGGVKIWCKIENINFHPSTSFLLLPTKYFGVSNQVNFCWIKKVLDQNLGLLVKVV